MICASSSVIPRCACRPCKCTTLCCVLYPRQAHQSVCWDRFLLMSSGRLHHVAPCRTYAVRMYRALLSDSRYCLATRILPWQLSQPLLNRRAGAWQFRVRMHHSCAHSAPFTLRSMSTATLVSLSLFGRCAISSAGGAAFANHRTVAIC